ncbi:hypothetical protein DH2020_033344 [Rehmannia glutinosa]|uniref:Uncharacterized protein n=1 Tax=Rehmannia glutinosa TaxID=99300 RepID=A0ABR0VCJ5_REHGL
MPHILTEPKPKTEESSTLPPIIIKKMVQISHLPEKMTEKSNPAAIGTRGTVGSLVMQEIDYFSRLELADRNKHPHQDQLSKPKVESVGPIATKKKRGGRKRCIPRICSTVEVAESNQQNFTYTNLKADIKRSLVGLCVS